MTETMQIDQRDNLMAQLEAKYRLQIETLGQLNFKDMMPMHEKTQPFSVIFLFFLYPMMKMNGEVFHIESPLRYVILYPVLVNRQLATFAAAFSRGVSFSTVFNDGSIVVSTNFHSQEINKPDRKVYRFAPKEAISIEDAWTLHQERINELLQEEGMELATDFTLERYEKLIHRVESALRIK